MKKHKNNTLPPKTHTEILLDIPSKSDSLSKEPKDGAFIQYDASGSFNSNGTVRYGEETDVDDI
jgi:hypothetical protein